MFKQLVDLNDGTGHIIDEGDIIYKPTSAMWYIISEVKYISTSEGHSEVVFKISYRNGSNKNIKGFEINTQDLVNNFQKLVYMTQEEEDDLLSIYWDAPEDEDELED